MSKLYLFFVVAAVVQMCLAQAITQTKCAEKGGEYSQVFGNAIFANNEWITLSSGRNTTLATVCIKFHEECLNAGAGCPLYITLSTNFEYFKHVDENNKIIVVEAEWDWTTDTIYGVGSPIKNAFAAIPRAIDATFAGLDRSKIYLIGWSAAAAGISRGLMETYRGVDRSPYGGTSNIYAAVAAIGACIATNDATQWGRGQDTALCGHFHVFNTVGQNDTTYTRDECLQSMQELAVTNKCSRVNSDWCLAQNNDPYVPAAQDDQVRYIDFGDCEGGDVRGYSFTGQRKVTTYLNTSPDTNAFDVVWSWLQGREKPFGQGQMGAHEGNLQFCNATRTPAASWTFQREQCNFETAFTTTDAKFVITMPTYGRLGSASTLSLSAGLLLAAALLLA
jgi:hypothetical protein